MQHLTCQDTAMYHTSRNCHDWSETEQGKHCNNAARDQTDLLRAARMVLRSLWVGASPKAGAVVRRMCTNGPEKAARNCGHSLVCTSSMLSHTSRAKLMRCSIAATKHQY